MAQMKSDMRINENLSTTNTTIARSRHMNYICKTNDYHNHPRIPGWAGFILLLSWQDSGVGGVSR
jgi:hypothetical protein